MTYQFAENKMYFKQIPTARARPHRGNFTCDQLKHELCYHRILLLGPYGRGLIALDHPAILTSQHHFQPSIAQLGTNYLGQPVANQCS